MSEQQASQSPHLDAVDRRILRLLIEDAQQSARAIARAIEMSPGAASERIARLERTGVIRGYHADVSREALGYDLDALIALEIEQKPPLSEMVKHLAAIPEVASIHVVTGRWDLMIQIHARNHRHLQELILSNVWEIPGFRHSETMLILQSTSQTHDSLLNMLNFPEAPTAARTD